MMFKQINDILRELQAVYDNLYKTYESLEKDIEDKKSKEVVKYVLNKKKQFAKMIEDYQSEGRKEILESWIQFSPDFDFKKHSVEMAKENLNIIKLNSIFIHFEEWLIDYYKFIIEKTSSSRVKEAFEIILERQKNDSKSITTAVKLLQDI